MFSRYSRTRRAAAPLTFGIEVEANLWDSLPREWRTTIARTLEHACPDVSIKSTDECDDDRYDCWTVSKDLTVGGGQGRAFPLELVSRVLPFNDRSLSEIRSVISALGSFYDVTDDKTTGFHVHVGSGVQGLPLRTLQNVALLTVGFEHLFNAFHPDWRIFPMKFGLIRYAKRASEVNTLSHLWPGFERMNAILNCRTFLDLKECIQPHHDCDRYAALNLAPMGGTSSGASHKRTIEFRLHAGTCNPDAMCAWVKVVCSLVQYAHTTTDDALTTLLCQVDDPSFDTLQLLREIGCGHLVDYYRSRLYSRSIRDQPVPTPEYDLHAPQRELFISRMSKRDGKMRDIEEELRRRGAHDLRGVTLATYDKNRDHLHNPWILWDDFPFDCPWDARMAAWSGMPLLQTPWMSKPRASSRVLELD